MCVCGITGAQRTCLTLFDVLSSSHLYLVLAYRIELCFFLLCVSIICEREVVLRQVHGKHQALFVDVYMVGSSNRVYTLFISRIPMSRSFHVTYLSHKSKLV